MSRKHLDRLIENVRSAGAESPEDQPHVIDVGMTGPEMQALLRPPGTYRKSKRQIERETRQARYQWARDELLKDGKDPTDKAIGEKLEYQEPDRAMRRWREAGDIP